MITTQQARPGMTVLYCGEPTTVLTGHYEDPELGWMIKTSKFPGGMPLDKYDPFIPGKEEADATSSHPDVIEAALPAISFELAIIDEPDPVRITAAIIRQKSKVLTDLTIKNMFDQAGYDAVKKAVTKAVKTRTSIEKKEKEILDAMKLRHASEKKEVTDYTAELYIACREAQTALEGKLTVIDKARKEEQDKLDAEEMARTEGRDQKMYECGLTFNGQAFVGFGKTITKNSLHSFSQEAFDSLVTELEVLQMDSEVSGKPHVQPLTAPGVENGGSARFSQSYAGPNPTLKTEYPTAIYDKTVNNAYRIVLTKGQVLPQHIEKEAVVINDRIAESAIYIQVIEIK